MYIVSLTTLKERDHGRILKWIAKKCNGMVYNGFNWLRTRTSGALSKHGNEH
jgi:hypothetical protein